MIPQQETYKDIKITNLTNPEYLDVIMQRNWKSHLVVDNDARYKKDGDVHFLRCYGEGTADRASQFIKQQNYGTIV